MFITIVCERCRPTRPRPMHCRLALGPLCPRSARLPPLLALALRPRSARSLRRPPALRPSGTPTMGGGRPAGRAGRREILRLYGRPSARSAGEPAPATRAATAAATAASPPPGPRPRSRSACRSWRRLPGRSRPRAARAELEALLRPAQHASGRGATERGDTESHSRRRHSEAAGRGKTRIKETRAAREAQRKREEKESGRRGRPGRRKMSREQGGGGSIPPKSGSLAWPHLSVEAGEAAASRRAASINARMRRLARSRAPSATLLLLPPHEKPSWGGLLKRKRLHQTPPCGGGGEEQIYIYIYIYI